MKFDLAGNRTRERKHACVSCGKMTDCDICWEHVGDWSPFGIRNCFICEMPIAIFDGGASAMRCEFCGADEAEFTTKKHHG